MSTIYKFRMLSGESDYFIREYEVPGDMKLIELNDFICNDLHFDKESVTSFFTSNALWEKEREFTRLDMNAFEGEANGRTPVPMGEMLINQIVGRNRDRLIFLFDVFSDRNLFLELTETKKRAEGIKYPRKVLSKGDGPKQFDSGRDGGIFDDMLNEFENFDSFENYEIDEFAGDY